MSFYDAALRNGPVRFPLSLMTNRLGRRLNPSTAATRVAVATAATTATAVLGTLATTPGARWYKGLDKPSWQPPGSVFGPVWTLLYADIAAMSGLHLADLREQGHSDAERTFAVALGVNLALNASWSWVFFRQHRLVTSTVVAAALAASSADLVRRVGETNRDRGAMLAPYAAWTLFATALTDAVRRRNG